MTARYCIISFILNYVADPLINIIIIFHRCPVLCVYCMVLLYINVQMVKLFLGHVYRR